MRIVRERDWCKVAEEYVQDAPRSYVVLDHFLEESAAHDFRDQLLNHYGWRVKSWTSRNLHNARPDIPHYEAIASELSERIPDILDGRQLMSHWALMYQSEVGQGNVHADASGVTLTLWLTPDEFNKNPGGGGLTIFDVLRPERENVVDGLREDWATEQVERETAGERAWISIPYAFNRAVLFNGACFHRSEGVDFDLTNPEGARVNAALAFDTPERWAQVMGSYA